jgi:hypothetical protein
MVLVTVVSLLAVLPAANSVASPEPVPTAAPKQVAASQTPRPGAPQAAPPPKVVSAGDCAALRKRLEEFRRKGLQAVSCVEPTRQPVGTEGLAPGDPLPIPDWCISRPTENWWAQRYEGCGLFHLTYNIINPQTGAIIGQGLLLLSELIHLQQTARTWTVEVGLNMYQASGLVLTNPTTVDPAMACAPGCFVLSETPPFGPVPIVVNQPLRGAWTLTVSTPNEPEILTLQMTFSLLFATAGTVPFQPLIEVPSAPVRCDRTTTLGRLSPGCVFAFYTPFFILALTGQGVDEAAQHVQDAQRDLPDHWGSVERGGLPLRRMTDAIRQRANRRLACPPSFPRPPGTSCDEYPFASTYQGAAFVGVNRVSARAINDDHNLKAGGDLIGFEKQMRLLDDDQYWVAVVP